MPIEPQQPAGYQPNPLMPPGPEPLVMEAFEGINTAALRPGVPEKQCAWMDGFMPLAPRNLRTLYGAADAFYTTAQTVVLFGFFNIGPNEFIVVFLSNGSVVQVAISNGAVTTILPAGTITTPTALNIGFSQYGSTHLIIVADQPDGYWIWDSVALYGPGTISPFFDITDAGSGYTSVPSIVVSGGSGTGIVLAAEIEGGFVTDIKVVNAGSGYLAGDVLTLTFLGGQSSGTGAVLTANMTTDPGGTGASLTANVTAVAGHFEITSVTINSGGSGYSPFTTYGFFGPSSFLTTPVLQLTITGGVITNVAVVYGGYSVTSQAPSIAVNDSGNTYVASVTINNPGSGYSGTAVATASGGTSPVVQATFNLTVNPAGGAITAVGVSGPGIYAGGTPTITITDTPITATATATLMPFGIQGSTVETYAGHVWVASGDVFYFSAPGSIIDFSTANGGGNNTSSDSTLRVHYTRLIAANGFLWLLGDSSYSYISGVQTAGSPITTTYTLQNADPEAGTPWPYSVNTFGRNVVFANTWGVQQGNGSAVAKVSDMLDGIYNSVVPADIIRNSFTFQPSVAKANLFGRKVWMLLIPIINPVTQENANKLLMWDGKRWWASSQNVALTFIASQETNSLLIAWGTDGNNIYRLFQEPSTGFTKYVQSRLVDVAGYWMASASTRFWAMLKYYDLTTPVIHVTIDNEDYPSNVQTLDLSPTAPATGITVLQPTAAAQQGVLTGFTLSTTDANMAFISAALKPEIVQYRG